MIYKLKLVTQNLNLFEDFSIHFKNRKTIVGDYFLTEEKCFSIVGQEDRRVWRKFVVFVFHILYKKAESGEEERTTSRQLFV